MTVLDVWPTLPEMTVFAGIWYHTVNADRSGHRGIPVPHCQSRPC
ncbi:hypothetical protein ACFIFS_001372 [Escherichia coli]